jgi:hypothetical protein
MENLPVLLRNIQLKPAKILRYAEKKIRYKKIRYTEWHFYIRNSHTLLRTTLYSK